MKEESFLLVSLEESKAKHLAQVISNDTCRKILDNLSKKPSTETDLAKELNLPISTVHYNLKNLVDSNLVVVEEFHYSKKGKEVNHYSLANKLIIIAPKNSQGISEKLKSLFSIAAIGVGIAAIIEYFPNIVGFGSQKMMAKSAMAQEATFSMAQDSMLATSRQALDQVPQAEPHIALWFLLGTIFALISVIVADWIRKK